MLLAGLADAKKRQTLVIVHRKLARDSMTKEARVIARVHINGLNFRLFFLPSRFYAEACKFLEISRLLRPLSLPSFLAFQITYLLWILRTVEVI